MFTATLMLLLTYGVPQSVSGDNVHQKLASGQEGQYRFASVASKSSICSTVGTEILARSGGSVVDAAVATLACLGVVTPQSCGIGGDSFWTYYERKSGKVYSITARSMVPLASNSTMYVNKTGATPEGDISVAVPGELLGSWEAHTRFGKLPWKDLFQPAIKLTEEGFRVAESTDDAIKHETEVLDRWPFLKSIVTNPITKTWYKAGEVMRLPLLARTLRRIADNGAQDFYNGSLADEIIEEIQNAGGIITKEDLRQYRVEFAEPLRLNLHGNLTMYSPPLPSGGAVLQYILNILNVANLTSPSQGEAIRQKIQDCKTFNFKEYNPSFTVQEDRVTAQISILGPNGDAVSMMTTINYYFGSKVVGSKTGIFYNNMMDDFSVPGVVNLFGVQPSPANLIKPGKRPLSSMSPSIVVDSEGMVVLVVGCAGGTRIITTNAFLTAMTLWLGEGIKGAIDAPRLHHQLYPDQIQIKSGPKWLVEGLRKKGHVVVNDTSFTSVPTGVLQRQFGFIKANAQKASVDGY